MKNRRRRMQQMSDAVWQLVIVGGLLGLLKGGPHE